MEHSEITPQGRSDTHPGERLFAFVGSFDPRRSSPHNAFTVYECDQESGVLRPTSVVPIVISVGNTCLDLRRNVLYCTDETTTNPDFYADQDIGGHENYAVGGGGRVFAFRIDPATGALSEINHRLSYGSLPAYPAIDATGEFLVVSHHTDKEAVTKVKIGPTGEYEVTLDFDQTTTVLFPLAPDGSIGPPCDVYTHEGDGGPLARQNHPQLHSIMAWPGTDRFIACDKGSDRLILFRINYANAKLEVSDPPGHQVIPGGSPRYTAFHPTLPYLFVDYELKAVVESFRYDERGSLESVSVVDALPGDIADNFSMQLSDIRVHPNGKFLYVLIRGVHGVAVFSIDEATAKLEKIQNVTLDGRGPRGAAISPDGRFLYIAARRSDEVLIWSIDENGSISPTGLRQRHEKAGNVTLFTVSEGGASDDRDATERPVPADAVPRSVPVV